MSTEEKINQLQMFEQGMQTLVAQKQQFQSQLVETESALGELGKSTDAYKMVGNIMVAATKEDLKKELTKKKEALQIRMRTMEKQELQLKEKATTLQKEVLQQIKK